MYCWLILIHSWTCRSASIDIDCSICELTLTPWAATYYPYQFHLHSLTQELYFPSQPASTSDCLMLTMTMNCALALLPIIQLPFINGLSPAHCLRFPLLVTKRNTSFRSSMRMCSCESQPQQLSDIQCVLLAESAIENLLFQHNVQ